MDVFTINGKRGIIIYSKGIYNFMINGVSICKNKDRAKLIGIAKKIKVLVK